MCRSCIHWQRRTNCGSWCLQEGQSATQSLFPVGWIHTHPAFDCFLSSVDMHNQFGYQVRIPAGQIGQQQCFTCQALPSSWRHTLRVAQHLTFMTC